MDNGYARLRFVDIPGVTEHIRSVPAGRVSPVKLSHGSRVWLESTHGWLAGEVAGHRGYGRYLVRILGISGDITVEEEQLLVRWNRPLTDLVTAVAHGFCDSPEYYEARQPFLDQLVQQRAVARGFTAALSAPIGLYEHQLDTAARVLADPVQRYLLADEVGLGKTIEAGLVIRQLLLDDPGATVLVTAPTTLVNQWVEELYDRFLLDEAIDNGRLMLSPHDQLGSGDTLPHFSLVVVDEAHQLVDRLERFPPQLRENLLNTKALLLLSATPMRRNHSTFLDLLNLVDPVAFPRDDIDGFRSRVREREKEASDLELLASPRAARRHRLSILNGLLALHRSDPVVVRMVEECRSEEDGAAPVWAELAAYVRETYRISRRMIRHRRNTPATEQYPVAGRKAVFIELDDPARPLVDAFLEQYQECLVDRPAHHELYARAVLNGLAGPRALLHHLKRRLAASPAGSDGVPPDDRALLEATAARLELTDTSYRLRAVLEVVQERLDQGLKVVVVSNSANSARDFLALAEKRWPKLVDRHFADARQKDHEEVVWAFLSGKGGRVLVGDQSIEEGRNLQDAHVLVNLDLPLDLNRLEQRIGRLDRYSRRPEAAEIVVFTEPASEWVESHLRLLADGVGIFDQSVATLQHSLTELLAELTIRLHQSGRVGFDLNLSELRHNLDNERDEVDLLEEVESGTVTSNFDQAAVVEIREAEQDPTRMRAAFAQLVTRRGGIGLQVYENPENGILSFGSDIHSLSAEAVEEVRPLLKRRRAFGRDAAMARRGTAPLRLGDPLVDWLARYLQADERGRARAFIRPYSGVQVPTLWMSCDFLVEFDVSRLAAYDEGVRRRLQRRADALLPPAVVRTWSSPSGPAPTALVRDVQALPFGQASDRVLRDRLWEDVLSALPDWQQLCRMAGEVAHESLRASPALTTAPAAATRRAQAEVSSRVAVLRARSQRLASPGERASAHEDLKSEEALGQALIQGVNNPAVSMTACGAVVLWPVR